MKFWTSLPHDGLTMKMSPRVKYTIYNSAPTYGLKTRLLQKESLMFDVNPSIPIKTELSDLKKNGEISDAQFLKFKSDLASFLSVLCAHLVEKSQIKCSLTRNAQCFIPNLLLEAPETSEKRFNHLLEDLFTSQKMPGKMVAEAKHEFTKFWKDVVTTHKEEFWGFDMAVKDHRLDPF